jgi:23S rRNA (uracil1939-C5)-methyltransferase
MKSDIFTAPVEELAAGGAGVVHYNGLCVFVDMTAPGDVITGQITEMHKGFARARLVEVVQPAPVRVVPLCPYYGRCGGCSLQHVEYSAQVAGKVHIVQEALTRIGGLQHLPPLLCRKSQPWEYRNRVQFHRVGAGFGYKERGGSAVVAVTDCLVADLAIRHALQNGDLALSFERGTVYARGAVFLCEGGRSWGTVRIRDRDLALDAGVFFQSNGALLEVLIDDLLMVADRADPLRPAADLYCGVGTFAAFLQDRFESLDLVEENKAAITRAHENVTVPGASFFTISAGMWRPEKPYSFIVADPPRTGLAPALCRRLCCLKHLALVYVSCNPATLARDLRDLCAGGYALESVTVYDFYPQTSHIEIMAVLMS